MCLDRHKKMKNRVQFISLEEDEKDLIISFAIDDLDLGIKSLILLRTPFYEPLLTESDKGVNVSFEGDNNVQDDYNMLDSILIDSKKIIIITSIKSYELDISNIEKEEIEEMVELLYKQNFDNRFSINLNY